ncbi:MAG: bifunctional 4-hydroxy-2-oxoglutarate aldolase/2-dehydro-3-deoxy-phosphogluconate aldolase [Leptolyngbyaceae cyanobacterium CRU_2_3]|nr:bifunctional 4-hydroxy-2-oxoglutarate aldolase/2-dehydro-3-deoxy-phosphogluconate aldolase [Leptolyngbyaceae cyanobacterium CRU_2_3]
MPSPESWLSVVRSQQAIAVIRASSLEQGIQMAHAVAAGGMKLIEISWNSDRPADLIGQLCNQLPHCWIGAGTLLTQLDLQAAIDAGAQFLFTPHVNLDLVQTAVRLECPIIAGALTPSEIVSAWQAGATCVKVFPIQAVGGADYIRHLRSPLEQIPLIPTGGVTLDNATDFLQAGAIAVGLAGHLFPKMAVAAGNWMEITHKAADLIQRLQLMKDRVIQDQPSC